MTPPVLVLERVAYGFGERTLVSELSLDVPVTGVVGVLGPAGVGKSTLVRMLVRRAELLPAFWHVGTIRLSGRDLFTETIPAEVRRHLALLEQKARLYTASVLDNLLAAFDTPMTVGDKRDLAQGLIERYRLPAELAGQLGAPAVSLPLGLQRRLTLARILAGEPAVLLVDEPTRDVPADQARAIEEMIAREAERRAVLFITHDVGLARRIAAWTLLLCGGRVAASCPARQFFDHPPGELCRRFVETGNCWSVADEPAPAPLAGRPPVRAQPSSFRWILDGRLGGMARPGLVDDEEEALAALRALGVHTLVTLEEQPFPRERLRGFGLHGEHLPVPDMGAPDLERAFAMCAATAARLADGQPTVFHCKAGLGRTGTLLAAYLVFTGADALHALEEVRSVGTGYVQSEEQERFLHAFARHCRAEEARSGAR